MKNGKRAAARDEIEPDSKKTALTQASPSQIPGSVAEEESQSLDSAEIVEVMLTNVKGSVRNSQYQRFYDTLFNLIGSALF